MNDKESYKPVIEVYTTSSNIEDNRTAAYNTSWRPMHGGGTNFKTRKLVKKDSNRIEFKNTLFMTIIPFLLMGPFIVWVFVFFLKDEVLIQILSLLPTLAFMGVGVFIYIRTNKNIVFDKTHGYYWKRKGSPNFNSMDDKNLVKLKEIVGIQLIQEFVSGDKNRYYSYEINLVLKDNGRLNVIDHGDKHSIIRDSQQLADFLQKPLWKQRF